MDLVPQPNYQLTEFTRDQIELIKTQIAKGATDDELKLFLEVCKSTQLNPFMKQIYAIKRNSKGGSQMTIQCSIDGYRAIAHRTGLCLSIGDPVFEYKGANVNIPYSATITVEKIVGNHVGKFIATAYWSDYYGDGSSFMANSKPRIMLGKVVEALCLRKAFSQELSALRTSDEMRIADVEENKINQDNAFTEKVIEVETYREEFDSMVDYITKQCSLLWSKINNEQKTKLYANILKIKNSNDLKNKSLADLREAHTAFNEYVKTLDSAPRE